MAFFPTYFPLFLKPNYDNLFLNFIQINAKL